MKVAKPKGRLRGETAGTGPREGRKTDGLAPELFSVARSTRPYRTGR